jgi:pyruvate dehydrogenase complex dehydrogenase (E1) component
MLLTKEERQTDLNPQETSEWLEALEQVVEEAGPDRAAYLLKQLLERARGNGVDASTPAITSSGAAMETNRATSSITRGTPRRASTRGHTSKAA